RDTAVESGRADSAALFRCGRVRAEQLEQLSANSVRVAAHVHISVGPLIPDRGRYVRVQRSCDTIESQYVAIPHLAQRATAEAFGCHVYSSRHSAGSS